MKVRLLIEFERDDILNESIPDFGEVLQRQKVLDGLFTTLAEEATQRTTRKSKEITVVVHMQCLERNVEWFNYNVEVEDFSTLDEPNDELWNKLLNHPMFKKNVEKYALLDMMVGMFSKMVDARVDEFSLLMAPQAEIRVYIGERIQKESA